MQPMYDDRTLAALLYVGFMTATRCRPTLLEVIPTIHQHGGCLESRKSTSGYVFQICGGAVSWSSRKQTVVATSSCEAEFIALCEACKEASWLRSIVSDVLGLKKDPTFPLECDNDGTIAFSHNQSLEEIVFTGRSF